MTYDRTRLEILDEESENQLNLIAEIIAEEIDALVSVRDVDVEDEGWRVRASEIAADALLNTFVVRIRDEKSPRSRIVSTRQSD